MSFPLRLLVIAVAAAGLAGAPAFAQREAESLSASFRKAAERVLPSIVAVRALGLAEPGFRFPATGGAWGLPGDTVAGMSARRRGMIEPLRGPGGSGVAIDASRGLILTTEQAVAGASRVAVAFTDGREVETQRVVHDPRSELVLLAIDPKIVRLKEVEWGSSEGLQLGDWVLSVGRPSGRTHAVSAGIVGGRGLGLAAGLEDDAIRTDAAMSQANAGGALIDLQGKVVGINHVQLDPRLVQDRFSYAIPAERARRFANELADFGQVRRGYLGLILEPSTALGLDAQGRSAALEVTGVTAASPAADAGFRIGDRIVAVDGQPVAGVEALSRAVEVAPVGQEFRITVDRQGKRQELAVRSRARPDAREVSPRSMVPARPGLGPRGRTGDRATGLIPRPAPLRRSDPVLRSESPDELPAQRTKPAQRPKESKPERAPEASPSPDLDPPPGLPPALESVPRESSGGK
jgi:serine protease Do